MAIEVTRYKVFSVRGFGGYDSSRKPGECECPLADEHCRSTILSVTPSLSSTASRWVFGTHQPWSTLPLSLNPTSAPAFTTLHKASQTFVLVYGQVKYGVPIPMARAYPSSLWTTFIELTVSLSPELSIVS